MIQFILSSWETRQQGDQGFEATGDSGSAKRDTIQRCCSGCSREQEGSFQKADLQRGAPISGPQLKRNNFHVDKALEGLLEDDLIHQKANGKYVLGSGHSEQSESSSSDGEAKVIVYFEHVP